MPPLNKFINNVRKHNRLMDKNLAANLIRHEYIVTGDVKAKRAQSKIESFIAKSMDIERKNQEKNFKNVKERINSNRIYEEFLQPADKQEISTKFINNLVPRFQTRKHGFTRILKLEPRLGEDKAPQSVLELVDSEYSIFFWFIAKTVARLELQKLPIDELTQHNVTKLTKFRGQQGETKFREAVEECKREFFLYNAETGEITSEEMRENLKNVPRQLESHGSILSSKKFKTMPRPQREAFELPKSPFLKE